MHSPPLLLLLTALLPLTINAEVFEYLNDPSLPPVTLSPEETKKLKPVLQGEAPIIPGKKLFARQCDYFCENTNQCTDPSTHRCCQGGFQCRIEKRCCLDTCAPIDAECCQGSGYCQAGFRCVRRLGSSNVFCNPSSGSSSTTEEEEPDIAITDTPITSTTRFTATRTSRTTTLTTSTPECQNSAHRLCPDDKFCCPSGDICYYDNFNVPRCWDGGSLIYYTYRWYYSWSYSFGVRWYVTTTSTMFSQDYSRVMKLTATTPETPPPTSEAVEPPETTSVPTDTAEGLVAGSPPDPEEGASRTTGDGTPEETGERFVSAGVGRADGRWRYVLGALAGVALGAAMA